MADEKAEKQTVIMVSSDQQAAREIADEFREWAKENKTLNEAKVPGGVYIGTDGRLHNGEGQPIKRDGTVVEKADDADEANDEELGEVKVAQREAKKRRDNPGAQAAQQHKKGK